MGKIESHSIFGRYTQTENIVTSALLQILKLGGTEFIGGVISQLDDIEFPSSEINVITQEKESNNVYDGLLECSFSFRVLVESKIVSENINEEQLNGLIANASNPSDYIVYITTDHQKPKLLELSDKIYWSNWKKILAILHELNPKTEPLNFLIHEFEKYLDFLNLLDIVSDDRRVQIAAGLMAEPIAMEYGFYACQNNRSIRPSKYLAFYRKGGIKTLFEIIGTPINDYDLSKDTRLSSYLAKYEPKYSAGDKRQFYELKLISDNLAIKNNTKNKNGENAAYTMGVFRYTDIDRLLMANTTDEL